VTDRLEAQHQLVNKHKESTIAVSVAEVCVPLAVRPGDQYHRVDGTQQSGSAMTVSWSQAFELLTINTSLLITWTSSLC